MSDKLISLGGVLKETQRFKGYIDDDMIERLSIAFKRLSTVKQPMTAREYLETEARMCKYYGMPSAFDLSGMTVDEAIELVEQFGKEHPERSEDDD